MRRIINLGLIFIFLYIPWFSGGEEIFPRSLIQAIILVLSILYLAKSKNLDSLWRKFYIFPSLHFPLCLILFFSFFSVTNSAYLYNSLISFIRIVTFVLFYFLLVEHLIDKGILKENYLFEIIFVSASILAIIGLFQSFLRLEIKATLPSPDFLAGYLAVGITLGIVELLTFRKWGGRNNINVNVKDIISQNKVPFMLYLITTLVMFVCLVLTRSLSGVLALLGAIMFITIFLYKKRAVYVILTIVGIFLIFPSTMKVFQLLGGETLKEFFLPILGIWGRCLEIISAHPLLGVGPGNLGNFRIASGYGSYMKFAYNEYLQMGAELGMIVVFLVCSVFYIIAKGVKKLLRSNLSLKSQAEVIATSAGALAVLTQGLFYFNLHLPAITFILIFFITKIMIAGHKQFLSLISPEEKAISLSDLKAPRWLRVASISFLSILFLLVCAIYLGNHYAYKGDYKKAVRLVPFNAEYHKGLADYYRKEGKQDKAIPIYGKSVKLHPREADYHNQLGHIYYRLKDKVSALKEFKLSVKHNPYNPFFHSDLGSYYLGHGEFEKAKLQYQKAVDIEPYYLLAHLRLGESQLGLKKVARAKEEFYKILKLKELLPQLISPGKDYQDRLFKFDYSGVNVGLGRCWMEEGNVIQAIAEYRKALKLNPYSAGGHSGLADVYFIQNRYDLAADEIKKAIRLAPQNEVYRMKLKAIEEAISGIELPSE